MPTFLNPETGITEKGRQEPPDDSYVPVHGSGTLLRTLDRHDRDLWTAIRVHWSKVHEYLDEGWEHVVWKKPPVPGEWITGQGSGVRFGFAKPSRAERRAATSDKEKPVIAVVLPDEPGIRSAAGCPGSRYYFQVGMIANGIPADYVAEKLLTYRARKLKVRPDSVASAIRDGNHDPWGRGEFPLSPWQKDQLAKLEELATLLSDELAEAAREAFGGSGQRYGSWSRRRQWQVKRGMKPT